MTTPRPEPDLRAAAKWLTDIWANNVAIERGSALWEDIQRLRAALSATTEPTLDAETAAAVRAWLAGDTKGLNGAMADLAARLSAPTDGGDAG